MPEPEHGANGRQPVLSLCIREPVAAASRGSRLSLDDKGDMNRKGLRPLIWYRETFIKSGYRCAYCRKDLIGNFEAWMGIEVDHVVPLSEGGSDKLTNRVAACSVCNGEKGRYVHPNHKRMTPKQILEAAREYVLSKRRAWRKVRLEAIEEFKRKAPNLALHRMAAPQRQLAVRKSRRGRHR